MNKFIKLLRAGASVGVVIAWYKGMRALVDFHYACCPELYDTPISMPLVVLPLLGLLLILPFFVTALLMASGYRLHRTQWFFLEITKPDKLRFRLTKRPGWTVRVLPLRTDGTSPYAVYWFSSYICFAALFVLFTVLAALCWRTPASRSLNIFAMGFGLWVFLMPLLPVKRNALDQVLVFRKSRDLRRAWECHLHIYAGIEQKIKLQDMPDEWFLPYPAEIADHPLVRTANFNRSSRLINQDRFHEGYDILRYFFDLKPAPETNGTIAGAILNGAICEALAELPPRCLGQLDHPSVQYMTPPSWQGRVLTVKYARALFLNHDAQEAAALLSQCEERLKTDDRDANIIRLLREKAEQA